MNFKFAPPEKAVLKDKNWCQRLGQFTGVHFPDIKPNSYDKNNMKFDSNVSIKVSFIANDYCL